MGPLTLADFIGLDTCLAIMKVLHDGLADTKYRPCPLLTKYVEAGWLGRKSQRGFYDYRVHIGAGAHRREQVELALDPSCIGLSSCESGWRRRVSEKRCASTPARQSRNRSSTSRPGSATSASMVSASASAENPRVRTSMPSASGWSSGFDGQQPRDQPHRQVVDHLVAEILERPDRRRSPGPGGAGHQHHVLRPASRRDVGSCRVTHPASAPRAQTQLWHRENAGRQPCGCGEWAARVRSRSAPPAAARFRPRPCRR